KSLNLVSEKTIQVRLFCCQFWVEIRKQDALVDKRHQTSPCPTKPFMSIDFLAIDNACLGKEV
ncbi:MAG: hypothetical protein RR711_12620, partial [Bacteroides sp.]